MFSSLFLLLLLIPHVLLFIINNYDCKVTLTMSDTNENTNTV